MNVNARNAANKPQPKAVGFEGFVSMQFLSSELDNWARTIIGKLMLSL